MHAMSHLAPSEDQRHHLDSLLMRESLLDKDVQKSTEVRSSGCCRIRT
jgi:molybdenum storage protein